MNPVSVESRGIVLKLAITAEGVESAGDWNIVIIPQ